MMRTVERKQFARRLAVMFFLAMYMGVGPGSLFANRPDPWLGLPQLYVWAVFWCAVEVGVVVLAYKYIWRADGD